MDETQLNEAIAALDPVVRDMLREDLPRQLREVELALRQDDLPGAAQAVHVIHGSASFCKLEDLQLSARSLEDALRNNDKNAVHIGAFTATLRQILQGLDQNHQDNKE